MGDSLIWHLCWQAAYGHSFFAPPHLADWICERLVEAHHRHDRVLVDVLLLPCEIHTLSRLTEADGPGNLSREVGSVVARRMRRMSRFEGHALRGRYLSHWIESEDELRDDVRMLAWRPVAAGVCRSPAHHAHGVYRIALGLSSLEGFSPRPMLETFGSPVPRAREALRRWVARRPTPEQVAYWELTRGLSPANACLDRSPSPSSVGGVQGEAAARLISAGAGGIDGAIALLESWARARLEGVAPGSASVEPAEASVRVRALVACLAVDHRLCAAAALARRYQRAKSTLSEHMVACRRRPREALLLETPVLQIVADVVGSPVQHKKS